MASEVSPFLGFTHELLHRSTVEIPSLGRGHCRAGRYLGRGADQPLLGLVQADVPRRPDFVHRLRVGNELPPRLLQSLVQLRIVLKWYGTDFAHCLGQTFCEFPFRLDAPVSVHHQIAQPGALQTGHHDLYRRPLFRYKQHPFPNCIQGHDQVGYGLRFAGARRAPDDHRLTPCGPVDRSVLARVSVQHQEFGFRRVKVRLIHRGVSDATGEGETGLLHSGDGGDQVVVA